MIYLDNAATTMVYPEALEAMMPYLSEQCGNPSSAYEYGRNAAKAVENARKEVATAIGALPEEIIFTSGGSEADNLAIKSTAFLRREAGLGNHIITSSIEHPAVLNTCKYLEQNGFEVTYLPVNAEGTVRIEDVEKAMRRDTILVSIMMANNEIGTIEPIQEIASMIRKDWCALVHTDAVQAVGTIPVDVNSLGVDMLSLSGHKFHAPKGVGALFVRKGLSLIPLIHGGGQENGYRSGTENVAGIVGMGRAIQISTNGIQDKAQRITGSRRMLEKLIYKNIPGSHIHGHYYHKLPGIINVSFDGIEGESLMLLLDQYGICVSTKSACHSGSLAPSHVLTALGVNERLAHGAIRVSIGIDTTPEQLNYFMHRLQDSVALLRRSAAIPTDNQ